MYPLLECDDHPGVREPGYCICRHVVTGTDIAHFERATPEEMGVICCASCYEKQGDQQHFLDNFTTICARGALGRGYLVGA